jgi:hypothetical protein
MSLSPSGRFVPCRPQQRKLDVVAWRPHHAQQPYRGPFSITERRPLSERVVFDNGAEYIAAVVLSVRNQRPTKRLKETYK